MPFFAALPVKGDSFLLSTGQKIVLVDGGYSSAALIASLGSIGHLDVVICTHGDRDHAGGVTDLLSQLGAPTVGEFWLPGRWAAHLAALLLDPEGFVAQLSEEIYALLAERPDFDSAPPLEELVLRNDESIALDGGVPEPPPAPADRVLDANPSWWAALAAEAQRASQPDPSWRTPAAPAEDTSGPLPEKERAKREAIVADAIDTANLIYKIAKQAASHRVPVRWFDFEAFALGHAPAGGWPKILVPVNACEMLVPPRPQRMSIARYIALSRINRESLVFQAIETSVMPSVLFCGDSPLRGGRRTPWPGFQSTPTKGLLATAPHHGRKSNAGAYAIVDAWKPGGRVTWVKAGNANTPCHELRARARSCTECVGLSLRPTVFAPAAVPAWGWWSSNPLCSC